MAWPTLLSWHLAFVQLHSGMGSAGHSWPPGHLEKSLLPYLVDSALELRGTRQDPLGAILSLDGCS